MEHFLYLEKTNDIFAYAIVPVYYTVHKQRHYCLFPLLNQTNKYICISNVNKSKNKSANRYGENLTLKVYTLYFAVLILMLALVPY